MKNFFSFHPITLSKIDSKSDLMLGDPPRLTTSRPVEEDTLSNGEKKNLLYRTLRESMQPKWLSRSSSATIEIDGDCNKQMIS